MKKILSLNFARIKLDDNTNPYALNNCYLERLTVWKGEGEREHGTQPRLI